MSITFHKPIRNLLLFNQISQVINLDDNSSFSTAIHFSSPDTFCSVILPPINLNDLLLWWDPKGENWLRQIISRLKGTPSGLGSRRLLLWRYDWWKVLPSIQLWEIQLQHLRRWKILSRSQQHRADNGSSPKDPTVTNPFNLSMGKALIRGSPPWIVWVWIRRNPD